MASSSSSNISSSHVHRCPRCDVEVSIGRLYPLRPHFQNSRGAELFCGACVLKVTNVPSVSDVLKERRRVASEWKLKVSGKVSYLVAFESFAPTSRLSLAQRCRELAAVFETDALLAEREKSLIESANRILTEVNRCDDPIDEADVTPDGLQTLMDGGTPLKTIEDKIDVQLKRQKRVEDTYTNATVELLMTINNISEQMKLLKQNDETQLLDPVNCVPKAPLVIVNDMPENINTLIPTPLSPNFAENDERNLMLLSPESVQIAVSDPKSDEGTQPSRNDHDIEQTQHFYSSLHNQPGVSGQSQTETGPTNLPAPLVPEVFRQPRRDQDSGTKALRDCDKRPGSFVTNRLSPNVQANNAPDQGIFFHGNGFGSTSTATAVSPDSSDSSEQTKDVERIQSNGTLGCEQMVDSWNLQRGLKSQQKSKSSKKSSRRLPSSKLLRDRAEWNADQSLDSIRSNAEEKSSDLTKLPRDHQVVQRKQKKIRFKFA